MNWNKDIVPITKHPDGTASFCIRVVTTGGARMQLAQSVPRPLAETLDYLEEKIQHLRESFKLDADPMAGDVRGGLPPAAPASSGD